MNSISKELRQFLAGRDVHATQKQQTLFKNHAGLCANLVMWAKEKLNTS